MNSRFVRQNVFPLVASLIWGTAFAAQSMGAQHLPAFSFNMSRWVVGALVLTLGLWVFRRFKPQDRPENTPLRRHNLVVGGLCCGSALGAASCLQQAGIGMTSAGKASFITALYIVLVPLFGLFFRRKVAPHVWAAVGVAVAGLYLISVKEGFSIGTGDILLLLCALSYAGQILFVDHFALKVHPVELSIAQMWVAGLWSAGGMILTERPTLEGFLGALLPILYVGIFSSGVAYTLQILAQKGSDPAVVSLLMSMESLFGALSGAILLQERMTTQEYMGCALMLAAVVLSQLEWPGKKKSE